MEKTKQTAPPRPTHAESKIYFKILLELEGVANKFYLFNDKDSKTLNLYAKTVLGRLEEYDMQCFHKGFVYEKFMCYEKEKGRPPYASYFTQVEKILKEKRLEQCNFIEMRLGNYITKDQEKIKYNKEDCLEWKQNIAKHEKQIKKIKTLREDGEWPLMHDYNWYY